MAMSSPDGDTRACDCQELGSKNDGSKQWPAIHDAEVTIDGKSLPAAGSCKHISPLTKLLAMHEPGANTVVYPPNAMNCCTRRLCDPTEYCTSRKLCRGTVARLSREMEKKLHKRKLGTHLYQQLPVGQRPRPTRQSIDANGSTSS